MLNRLRNESGSVVITSALIIGLVAVVFGAGIAVATISKSRQAEREANAIQAHYYAKTGAETAVGLIIAQIDSLDEFTGEDKWFYGNVDEPFVLNPPDPSSYTIAFRITRQGDWLTIDARGFGRNEYQVTASVSYVINLRELLQIVKEWTDGEGGGTPIALFADQIIGMTGSSTVSGTVATNSTAAKKVVFTGTSHIYNGYLYIGVGGDPSTVVSTPYASAPSNNTPVHNLKQVIVYPLPVFPEYPTNLPYRGSITTTWQGPVIIDQDGCYDEINVVNGWKLVIDLKGGTRVIRVKDLNIVQGDIELQNAGQNGKLLLYVEDTFAMAGSSKVNNNGNPRSVVVFYKGGSEINFTGDTRFYGSIFAQRANVTITGSAGIQGDIVTGGSSVTISGAADAVTRVVYAPKAALTITGSGRIRGTIVAASALLVGNSHIIGDSPLDLSFFKALDWPSGNVPVLAVGSDSSTQGYKGHWRPGSL